MDDPVDALWDAIHEVENEYEAWLASLPEAVREKHLAMRREYLGRLLFGGCLRCGRAQDPGTGQCPVCWN